MKNPFPSLAKLLPFLSTLSNNNTEELHAYKYLTLAYAVLEAFMFKDFTVRKDHFGHIANGIKISTYNMLFGKRWHLGRDVALIKFILSLKKAAIVSTAFINEKPQPHFSSEFFWSQFQLMSFSEMSICHQYIKDNFELRVIYKIVDKTQLNKR